MSATDTRGARSLLALLALALLLPIPALVLRIQGAHHDIHPVLGMAVFGVAIVASAFVLTWAAEVAEGDIGSGLAIVFLALVAVLPEYAVDLYFAWTAAADDTHRGFALANMTGANRLLLGVAWPTVALIAWWRFGRKEVSLPRERSADVTWLLVATVYSLVIPLKGTLAWYDAVALFSFYGLYIWCSKDDPEKHVELIGPPKVIAKLPGKRRGTATVLLFAWSAAAIIAAAEPFAESLIHGAGSLGIDEYLLVQWLAPFASESPEFLVVILLTLRGRSEMGLGTLVSSKVNQWTLLVGAVPLAYGLAHLPLGQPFAPSMEIDSRQVEEILLTATQGLYGVAVLADLRFSLRQAMMVLGLFLFQLVGTILLESLGHHTWIAPFHYGISALYVLLALERFFAQRRDLLERFTDTLQAIRR